MKQRGRGRSEEYVYIENGVVITNWYDSRQVLIVSNFLGFEPQNEAKGWDKKERKDDRCFTS